MCNWQITCSYAGVWAGTSKYIAGCVRPRTTLQNKYGIEPDLEERNRPAAFSVKDVVAYLDQLNSTRTQPLWYQEAVIYEVNVRAFFDGDRNGSGDFSGFIQKLDYVQSLGVTVLWLLPFYPSPWRDDGYDVSDYRGVHPAYGRIEHFIEFLHECKRRNLKVITELILNHTSDAHPWFERARRSLPGTRERDFYVWSDTPNRYSGVRVIFRDFEESNWTWEAVAQAYYWHRFFSHEPDVNFDSADVQQAVYDTVDFWLDLGVDGLRLDAVPYLFEREATTCENLPETHDFLRKLRRHIDSRYMDRMLLAEANQWPEDAVAYFGGGDECHMAFHFPLMPRVFMAIRMEDAFPLSNIVEETPDIPCNCQWATFLRNHDELTLEMVSEDDRDYMYRVYARDPEMRINLGIRRRLAPLVENDRRRIELLNALLFSLPGTPVIYYGDEIGMGDNLALGDRNGVRTPMQWNAEGNAGFSTAESEALYLPVISEGEYNYVFVNVEAQEKNRNSLLWWMRQALAIRRASAALRCGSIRLLRSDNRHVFTFLRQNDDEVVLVIANLSRFAQPVRLRLGEYSGFTPVELFGHVEFPQLSEPYSVFSLSPYAFYWFALHAPVNQDASTGGDDDCASVTFPNIASTFEWHNREVLGQALVQYLRRSSHPQPCDITHAEIVDLAQCGQMGCLAFVRVWFTGGDPELQLLPLSFAHPESLTGHLGDAVALVSTEPGERGLLSTRHYSGAISNMLLQLIANNESTDTKGGRLQGQSSTTFAANVAFDQVCLIPTGDSFEQRNASIRMSDQFILKLFRRLEPGPHPDVELPEFLFHQAQFHNVAPPIGTVQYVSPDDQLLTAAVLYSYIDSTHDLWQLTLDELSLLFERASTLSVSPGDSGFTSLFGTYMERVDCLARRSAQLHLALGSGANQVDFQAEGIDIFFLRGEYHGRVAMTRRILQELQSAVPSLPAGCDRLVDQLVQEASTIQAIFERLLSIPSHGKRIRVHGDFHLGQVLLQKADDVIFIDFEGDSTQPLSQRRIKRSPLTDVASMVYSFRYAGLMAALSESAGAFAETAGREKQLEWARVWYSHVRTAFLREYQRTLGNCELLPEDRTFHELLSIYIVAKAVYQLGYELENRRKWVPLALEVLLDCLAHEADVHVLATNDVSDRLNQSESAFQRPEKPFRCVISSQ